MRRSAVGAELEAELVVDLVDRRERIGHERAELHVDDPVGGHGAVGARRDRAVEPVDEIARELGGDVGDRDVVAPEPAQHAHERAERGDDPQRIAVRLHEQRVRVLGEQRAEAPEVAGRLQHPARRRVPRLQVLQVEAVPAVRGRHVGFVEQPVRVRRHAVLRREDHAAEVAAGHAHALLRQQRAHRVHRLEAGDHELDAVEQLLRRRDARIGVVGRGLGRRQRAIDLPRERHAVRGILREEVVQDRGAGARLADDDDRRHDVGVGDLGVLLAPVDEPEAGREVLDDLARRDLLAELVQVGFGAQRVDVALEARPPRRLAEVVEPGRLDRQSSTSRSVSSCGCRSCAAS